jgi:hypothetical protein
VTENVYSSEISATFYSVGKIFSIAYFFTDKPRIPNWFGDRVRKNSVLWIYGDSVSEQFYSGIRQHPLCSRVFGWCGHTYNWVYRLQG